MSSHSLVTRELLFTYFAGQATALQKQMIGRWVEDKPDNEEFFYACLHEWELRHPQYEADTDTAIAEFGERTLKGRPHLYDTGIEPRHFSGAKQPTGWRSLLVAASVACTILFGAWLLRDTIRYESYATGSGEMHSVTLSDGSRVILNANSFLQVPRFGFGQSSREVHLNGEALFSVIHTPDDKKFVVISDPSFQVEVLGTEFNLAARRGDTRVVLQKGKVKVSYKEEPTSEATSLIMAPGDLVTVNEEQKKLQVKKVRHPENYSAWQHGRFVFDKTSLADIKEIIQDNYRMEVSLKGIDESKVTVSGSFTARNGDELLMALSEILGINVIRQDNRVILLNPK